jgi:hypothetical protein
MTQTNQPPLQPHRAAGEHRIATGGPPGRGLQSLRPVVSKTGASMGFAGARLEVVGGRADEGRKARLQTRRRQWAGLIRSA